MTTLVTGGAGFIGSHVCETLVKQKEDVISIDNFNSFYNPKVKEKNIYWLKKQKNFKSIKGDITNYPLDLLLKKEKITKVIHLAASAGVRPSIENPSLYYESNIKGTLRWLKK